MIKTLLTAIVIACCEWFALIGQQTSPLSFYTAEQAAAGRTRFDSFCAQCHTDTLIGRPSSPALQAVPPLAGAAFMTKWGNRTTKDLYSRIQLVERMDEPTYLNLTAYIIQANGALPGTQALTAATVVEIRSVTMTSATTH